MIRSAILNDAFNTNSNLLPRECLPHNRIVDAVIEKLETLGKASAVESRLLNAVSYEEAIAEKNGALWRCTGKFPNQYGGNIFRVDLLDQYNQFSYPENNKEWRRAADKKNQSLFPAAEPTAKEVAELTFIPAEFGYFVECSEEGVFLYLPDDRALNGNYEILQLDPSSKWPKGVPLKICARKGIAGDREFVETYLLFDILLSLTKEFVHDHIFHVLRVLKCMLNVNYSTEKERLRTVVRTLYMRIIRAEEILKKEDVDDLRSQLPKLWTTLGAAVDLLWSAPDTKETENVDLKEFEEQFVTKIWDDADYQAFWMRKYQEKVDSTAVAKLWKEIGSVIK